MTVTHVDIIDKSVEKAHIWINDVATELGTEDRQYAYRVLRAFLHALRDHLPVNEAAALAAQLPIFVRGVFYEGWVPARSPERTRDLDGLLVRIADEALLAGETEASLAATAAKRVLARHVSVGETQSVLGVLPEHLRVFLSPEDGDADR